MLKKLGDLLGLGGDVGEDGDDGHLVSPEMAAHFHPGRCVRYRPELAGRHERDTWPRMETMVIGWRETVSGLWRWTGAEARGCDVGFRLAIPDTGHLEGRMDQMTRASLRQGRQFAPRNTVLLETDTGDGQVATLETEVAGIARAIDGPYAGHELVMLDAGSFTVEMRQNRRSARVGADLGVALSMGGWSGDGVLEDVSDETVRVSGGWGGTPQIGTRVCLKLAAGKPPRVYVMMASVLRAWDGRAILSVETVSDGGRERRVAKSDMAMLKAAAML